MKKYLVILIVTAVVLGAVIARNNYLNPKQKIDAPVESGLSQQLPEGWSEVQDTKVALKLEKKTEKGLKPQIVLINSTSKDATNPDKYLTRLIAGAKSTVGGFRVVSDKRSQDGDIYYSLLTGYYYNQKNKIDLIQRVYIKGETVNTMTASYTGEMAEEINRIFDTIVKEKAILQGN